jgi:hypothetical protein
MLGFLRRARRGPALPNERRARLCVEALETRECLSPVLGLSAQVLSGHLAQLSGVLTDINPANATVYFGGTVSGTATTDSSGHYSFSTTNASLGTVTAYAIDQGGQTSNTATASLTKSLPVITESVSYGSRRTVTILGTVSDMDPSGRTVTITGVVSGSVTTSSNGSYAYTATASGLGAVYASTVDLWGQSSNTAQLTLSVNPPQIANFQAIQNAGTLWTFSGTVLDQSACGLTVTFGGLPSLAGKQTIVGQDCTFSDSIILQSGESGVATAQTTDWWGQPSNVASATVKPMYHLVGLGGTTATQGSNPMVIVGLSGKELTNATFIAPSTGVGDTGSAGQSASPGNTAAGTGSANAANYPASAANAYAAVVAGPTNPIDRIAIVPEWTASALDGIPAAH